MKINLQQYWYNITNSLWFLPTVMALSAVAVAFAFIEIDQVITYDDLPFDWFVYAGQVQGARSVLSTIASSMVTIAGVTLSITLVALTMASSQFGPRLLRNFIADRGNQMVIGTFISTFIYSLIILLTIRGTDDSEFVPKISVVFAFLLAIWSLAVIIYFIHHVSVSIQADFVIKSSYNEFLTIAKNTTHDDKEELQDQLFYEDALLQTQMNYAHKEGAVFKDSGYIQNINYKGLCQWAKKNNLAVHLLVNPTGFATIHQNFAEVFYNETCIENWQEELLEFIGIGYQQTPSQNLLLPLMQIAEVGVRALSPGINDPHTTIACIRWIGAALSFLGKRKFSSPVFTDDDGEVRVMALPITYSNMASVCYDHLLVYAGSNKLVLHELMRSIVIACHAGINAKLKDALLEKANSIKQLSEQYDVHDGERMSISDLYDQIALA